MECEELISMNKALEDVQMVLGGLEIGLHIGLTEMQREKEWRKEFNKKRVMEVLERNETFGLLIKPDLFRSLQTYIEHLEQQVEQLQLEALFARREDKMDWMTGEDLNQKAKESFHARKDLIRGLLNDYK